MLSMKIVFPVFMVTHCKQIQTKAHDLLDDAIHAILFKHLVCPKLKPTDLLSKCFWGKNGSANIMKHLSST